MTLPARIRSLIARDKLGNGAVSASTVTEIALMLRPAPDPEDTLAERAAVVALLRPMLGRWITEGEIPRTEVTRFDEALNSIMLGLHR